MSNRISVFTIALSLTFVSPAHADLINLTTAPFTVSTSTVGDRTVTSTAGIEFGAISVGGNLNAAATTNITQTGALVIGGASNFAANGDVTLLQSNAFSGLLSLLVGSTGQVNAGGNLTLNTSTVGNHLAIFADQDLTTTGALTVGANAALTAGRNLTLGNTTVGNNLAVMAGSALNVTGPVATGSNLSLTSGLGTTINGSVSAGTALTVTAGTTLNVSGAIASASGATMSAGNNVVVGSTSVTGNVSINGGDSVQITGPLSVSGNASVSGGQHIGLGGLSIGGSLYSTALIDTTVSGTVAANALALSTSALIFDIFSPVSYGAFHIAGAATFSDVTSVLFSFDGGYFGIAGDYFDFILADTLTGLDEASFSVANLNPQLNYTITSTSDSLRLSLYTDNRVPEPMSLALILFGLMALVISRSNHRYYLFK